MGERLCNVMLCEYAYYPTNDKWEKPLCSNPKKIAEDKYFGNKCPLIYWCPIAGRFENTDISGCEFRKQK